MQSFTAGSTEGVYRMGTGSVPKRGDSSVMQTPLPVELQGQIGQRLREAYNELVSEPVPDRFILLLQQLKKTENQGQGGQS
ncbi:MAG TPA: NepR family anti-sigma factor [Hyphomicrobium sp.]|uniref:NepR family anti-sigma factor n=1 Tax=Hyphomicrobium sp. TaxID=82 RepID=UPI002B89E62B|nr:NepR family anti-sigma factor [Hyphomicrobium sp.]HXE02873.1 NepR family anti-sigma factor [Hyphomicrobium sp.]